MKKNFCKRAMAGALAVLLTAAPVTAYASEALGWELHAGKVPLNQGTFLEKTYFWSDRFSDLRTENFVTYTPGGLVQPKVTAGAKVLSRTTLTDLAKQLQAQGERLVSGINGDYFVMATGAPVGLVLSEGKLLVTPTYTTDQAIGFRADGSAFIGVPGLEVRAQLPGQNLLVRGGVNKIRRVPANGGAGGLTLLTDAFASDTQNTEAGVDVILAPVEGDGSLTVGGSVLCTVEQVVESSGRLPIPAGRLVLTLNSKDDAAQLAALRALLPGDPVTISVTTKDPRWCEAVEGLGTLYRLVENGAVRPGLNAERTARSAIGIKADGTLLFYTLDGRRPGHSVGGSLTQVASRLVEMGCVDAVCLDGGGSTTLGAVYPGDTGMSLVNRPADGRQRPVSTAIFLTAAQGTTGVLGSYYVTPSDAMLLAGASLPLSATALDTGYYPLAASEPVNWSVAGGGTVSPDGVFTAGRESGRSQVIAGTGPVSGTATITTVQTPDQIILSDETTGRVLTTLSLEPGRQINLKADATYRKLPLTAADTCFTWTLDPAVGSVTPDGVLTVEGGRGRGNLTVSAGGKSVTIPVRVSGEVKPLEGFETGMGSFQASSSADAAVETDLSWVRYGKQSLRVRYNAAAGTAELPAYAALTGGERYLTLWVYGDNSGNLLLGNVRNAAGQVEQLPFGTLNFSGWQPLRLTLPAGATGLEGLSIVCTGAGNTGTLWLDQLATSTEETADQTAPTVKITQEGNTARLTAADDLDTMLPRERMSLTLDGRPMDFSWDAKTGTGTAQLPLPGIGSHRMTLTASDASGNLGRASVDLPAAAGVGESPFADMNGHWARAYADYLYTERVSNGVGGPGGSLFFQPDKKISRAEFFAMTARWMGLDLSRYAQTELPFADAGQVPQWALPEVKAMYSLGILKGSSGPNGSLLVNAGAEISRAEAMTILGRTQAQGYPLAELPFADAGQVPDWSLPYVKALVGQGVVGGYENKISPQALITRGEVAKLLYSLR